MGPGVAGFGTEDAKRPSATESVDSQGMEVRFADLCKSGLELEDGIVEEAVALFGESKEILLGMLPIGNGSPMMVEKCWSAFLLYCVARLCTVKEKWEKEEGRIKLSKILQAVKLNAMEFFSEVSHFSLKVDTLLSSHYGPNWEEILKLKELQSDVEQLYCLSRFYKRAYHQLFKTSDRCSGRQLLASNDEDYVSDYHHFGWLLFLVLRARALSCCKDLVTCTYALVSVLAILILHVPTSLRKFSISDFPLLDKKSDKGVDLLAFLCQTYNVSEDELRRMMKIVNNVLVDVLKRKPSHASENYVRSLYDIGTDDLTYFEDLLDEKSLLSHLLFLNKDYELITGKVELNERMFLNVEEHEGAFTSPKKGKINTAFYPPASPVKGCSTGNPWVSDSTPVSCTMTAAKWLHEVISPFPPRPSSVLLHFLVSKDCDLLSTITDRANIIMEAIFPGHSGERCTPGSLQGANLMECAWAEHRKLESIKLYYRVLETICIAESERMNRNNLISLLSNERFHRCMLACSAELVLATHKTATMMFPAVLEKTGITAFDLSKVIESFVRYEETLPRDLKRHLNSLEERLLESMSWEKGSSLYNSLIIARSDLSAEINKLGLLAEPMPSLDAIILHNNIPTGRIQSMPLQVHGSSLGDSRSPKRLCSENRGLTDQNVLTSPIKESLITFHSPRPKLPSLQSAFASPACPSPSTGGETCAEAGITIFFSKILKLAAIRIKSLCERLGLPQQTLEHVYFLIQQILNQRTLLFFNRHIDQLILCSIYGVNKISNLDLTFKTIIYHYRKQPQCRAQVFRSVYWSLNQNSKKRHEYVDIITFYNAVFIPSVKPLLMEVSSKPERNYSMTQDKNCSNGNMPGSPQLSTFPNLPDMSPKKVSATHNVYVSPLRQSKMDALLAPSSKSYYACVGESTHAFQSPSKDLMVINSRLNCGSGRRIGGRLNFDMVSDSVVAGSLCPQNGSSASSAPGTAVDITVKTEADS